MNRGKRAPPLDYPKGQRDMVTATEPHCPTCGGPWKGASRVCRRCGQVISNNHKYRMVPAGPGLFAFEHRHCDSPTKYVAEKPRSDNAGN